MTNNDLFILIVDDEQPIRDLIKVCLDWGSLGMTIVGEAAHARDAIELVDRLQPDVILMDINMPHMNGIELSKTILSKQPDVKIVIISGYDDFQYAQQCVSIGISDYLLKPVDEEQLQNIMLELKHKIQEEQLQKQQIDLLHQQVKQSKPYLIERTLNELITVPLTDMAIKEKLTNYALPVRSPYQIAVLEVGRAGQDGSERVMPASFKSVSDRLRGESEMTVFTDNEHRIVIWAAGDAQSRLIDVCESLLTLVADQLAVQAIIGLGLRYEQISGIRHSYEEARSALGNKISMGWNNLYAYDEQISSDKNVHTVTKEQLEALSFALKAGLEIRALSIIDDIMPRARPNQIISLEQLQAQASTAISILTLVLQDADVSIDRVFKENGSPYEIIYKIDNVPDMKHYLQAAVKQTIEALRTQRERRTTVVVNDIKQYLDAEFSDPDVSLTKTAKAFYLNPSYLSRLFKEETGYNFGEYVAKLRIDHAISLLRQYDLTSAELSDKVGLKDPKYFSSYFKKYTGISLNEYKKLNHKAQKGLE